MLRSWQPASTHVHATGDCGTSVPYHNPGQSRQAAEGAGRAVESRYALLQAVILHREVGNRRFEGIALGDIALLHFAEGRVDEAARVFEQALAIHAEVGNRRYLGRTRCEYALLLLQPGQPEPARSLWLLDADVLRGLDHQKDINRATAEMRTACAEAGVPPFDQ